MKNWINRTLLLSAFLIVGLNVSASTSTLPYDLEPVYEWTEYITIDGIRIEYKFVECNNDVVNNQILVLLKYTNTTNETRELSWFTKVFRDGDCVNCHRIGSAEHEHTLKLVPNEVVAGDSHKRNDRRLYIFSNFIELSPGMSNQRLTDFEMINLNVIKY
jgi:hypothetical protein